MADKTERRRRLAKRHDELNAEAEELYGEQLRRHWDFWTTLSINEKQQMILLRRLRIQVEAEEAEKNKGRGGLQGKFKEEDYPNGKGPVSYTHLTLPTKA